MWKERDERDMGELSAGLNLDFILCLNHSGEKLCNEHLNPVPWT